jgi:FKBP-type peptidyl-prolyl cis-trans isomerase FklB
MIKPITIIGLLALGTLPSLAQQKSKPKTTQKQIKVAPMFESKIDSASYAFGLSMARDLKKRGLKELNAKLVASAIEDFFAGKPSPIKEEDEYKAISDVLTAAAEEQKKEQSAAGDKFLAENKIKAGVQTTASGLQYEIIRPATGPKPLATDSVTVNYKGALLDGKVFDSSYDRGEPISFQLNRVIQGWQEGLQLMPVGSHYRFYIPYQLGYGERGAGNDIPPFSVLVFDVELLKIGG